jgi:YcaO-like protein with predicted kinase domain
MRVVIEDLGGTVREVAARTTLERLKPLLPEFGITRIANVTGLDAIGIPVVTIVRPLARSLSVSQGKGVTLGLAHVSGIMESIEVFHAEQRRPPSAVAPIFESTRNPSFIDPYRVAIRADADLSEDQAIPWIEGMDLFDGHRKWIPEELLNLDFTRRATAPLFLSSSNGLASGNTRTEAVVHALCELIERDQTSFWSVERRMPEPGPNRRVLPETIKDPVCQALVQKCLTAGLEIFIWYITINIDIPVFVCTLADRKNRTLFPQHATGYGCHPFATVALSRAITEAAQSRLTHISGLREDLTWSRYREEFPCETRENRHWLAELSDQAAIVDFGTVSSLATGAPIGMSSLLNLVLETLRKADMRSAIIVDLAINEAFSVIFACVPDLEYLTPKARAVHLPGARMREYIKKNALKNHSR